MSINFSWVRKIVDESRQMNASIFKISANGSQEKCFTYNRQLRPTATGFAIVGKYFNLNGELSCQIDLVFSNNGDVQYKESHRGSGEISTVTISKTEALFKNNRGERIIRVDNQTWVSANFPYAVMLALSKTQTTQQLLLNFADVKAQQVHQVPVSISAIDSQQMCAQFTEADGQIGEMIFLTSTNQFLQWKGLMHPQVETSGHWHHFFGLMKFEI